MVNPDKMSPAMRAHLKDVAKRIKAVMTAENISANKLAKRDSSLPSYTNIQMVMDGEAQASYALLHYLSRVYGYSLDWLFFGLGKKKKDYKNYETIVERNTKIENVIETRKQRLKELDDEIDRKTLEDQELRDKLSKILTDIREFEELRDGAGYPTESIDLGDKITNVPCDQVKIPAGSSASLHTKGILIKYK